MAWIWAYSEQIDQIGIFCPTLAQVVALRLRVPLIDIILMPLDTYPPYFDCEISS